MANINGTSGNDLIRTAAAGGSNNALPNASPGGGDVIFGNDGADTILPDSGFNIVFGGLGNDSIALSSTVGGAGYAFGDAGDDVLLLTTSVYGELAGGTGNDTLTSSGSGLAFLRGELGNDLMTGGGGSDTLDGGDGNNTVSGGGSADLITAGTGADSLSGGDGDDRIEDRGGNGNTLSGGLGNDTLGGAGGTDVITAGDGNDLVQAGAGNNTVLGDLGNDTLYMGGGADSVLGGDGDDFIDAGTGANTISGGAGNDNIYSGGSADSLVGGTGNDTFIAASSADTVLGEDGDDSMDGGESADLLSGGAGDDTILAGSGSDTILGGVGSARIDGGYDTDLLDYSGLGAAARVFVDLQFGFNRVVKRDAGGVTGVDSVQGVESFTGTAGADKFIGWGQDETFTGGAGNDTFDGNDGFDGVRFDVAGAGNVFVDLLAGFAQDGLGGTDRFRKTSATNSTVEIITTGGGADTIIGDGDNNTIRGGLGADSLDGGNGSDLLDFLGDSTITGALANMSNATVGGVAAGRARDSGNSLDLIANFENIRGTEAADTLIGSDADNALRGHRGNDLLDGGMDYDTVDYRNDSDGAGTLPGTSDGFGVIVNLSDAAVTIPGFGAETNVVVGALRGRDGWGGTDTLVGIEAARGTNINDILIGAARVLSFTVDVLRFTTTERSFLYGRLGNDTLRAATADDGVVASYSDDISGIVARLDLGSTVVDGFGTTDTLVNVRNIQGSDFDDLIVAGSLGGWFRGRAGNDTITGNATAFDTASYSSAAGTVLVNLLTGVVQDGDGGTDSLSGIDFVSGATGADTIIGDNDGNWFFGHAGADSLIGGLGQDWVSYHSAWVNVTSPIHSAVLVNLGTQTARDGDGSSATGSLDRLVSIEHAVGSHTADTLIGSTGANSLVGGEGNDSINGGAGNDVLEGSAGADTLNGSADSDTASYAGAQAAVTVSLALLTAQVGAGDGLGDILSAIENLTGSAFGDSLSGNAVANLIQGGAGADSLIGGAGNDTLTGGVGSDSMNGGAGSDAFLFASPTEHTTSATARDRIFDLVSGTDVVQVVSAAFGGLPLGVLAAGRFALNASADGDDVFVFNTTTKVLSYDADGTGAGLAVQLALMNVATMANTDIVVV